MSAADKNTKTRNSEGAKTQEVSREKAYNSAVAAAEHAEQELEAMKQRVETLESKQADGQRKSSNSSNPEKPNKFPTEQDLFGSTTATNSENSSDQVEPQGDATAEMRKDSIPCCRNCYAA